MRIKIVPTLWITLLVIVQLFVNCSNPLEDSESNTPNPNPAIDTLFVFDTVLVFDTVSISDTITIIDTLAFVDTLIFVDTVFTVDTVIVVDPDSTGLNTVCGRIACNQKEIVWMFHNSPGDFKLEFSVSTASDHPIQHLIVDIDGEQFSWNAQEEREIILNLSLDLHAIINIESTKPPAYGHPIDVCLTITRE